MGGYANNHFFDNSVNNPLFAAWGGPITEPTEWEAGDVGESVYGEARRIEGYSGYSGPLRPWGQLSSGLAEEDFMHVRYVEYSDDPVSRYTDVIIVPEPATMLLLALGGIALARKRRQA